MRGWTFNGGSAHAQVTINRGKRMRDTRYGYEAISNARGTLSSRGLHVLPDRRALAAVRR